MRAPRLTLAGCTRVIAERHEGKRGRDADRRVERERAEQECDDRVHGEPPDA